MAGEKTREENRKKQHKDSGESSTVVAAALHDIPGDGGGCGGVYVGC